MRTTLIFTAFLLTIVLLAHGTADKKNEQPADPSGDGTYGVVVDDGCPF